MGSRRGQGGQGEQADPRTSSARCHISGKLVGPTIGFAVNVTLMSYNGQCDIAMTIDTGAIPDQDVLVESMREGFEEVLELGGDHTPPYFPLHDP